MELHLLWARDGSTGGGQPGQPLTSIPVVCDQYVPHLDAAPSMAVRSRRRRRCGSYVYVIKITHIYIYHSTLGGHIQLNRLENEHMHACAHAHHSKRSAALLVTAWWCVGGGPLHWGKGQPSGHAHCTGMQAAAAKCWWTDNDAWGLMWLQQGMEHHSDVQTPPPSKTPLSIATDLYGRNSCGASGAVPSQKKWDSHCRGCGCVIKITEECLHRVVAFPTLVASAASCAWYCSEWSRS